MKPRDYKYLDSIDSPADLKTLAKENLDEVCSELRQFIIDEISKNPGHLDSSLGTVELSVALHYVFDTPYDRVVWTLGIKLMGIRFSRGGVSFFIPIVNWEGSVVSLRPKRANTMPLGWGIRLHPFRQAWVCRWLRC